MRKAVAFNLSKCIKGESAPSSDNKKCLGWTLFDQLEYVQTKIHLKERYTQFYKEEFQHTIKQNTKQLSEMTSGNLNIRRKMNQALNPDSKIIAAALRYDKNKQLAYKDHGIDRAIWAMNQVFSSLRHDYDALHFTRLQREKYYNTVNEKHEKLVYIVKTKTIATIIQNLKTKITEQENELEHAKTRHDTSWFVYLQYQAIKRQLSDDMIEVNYALGDLEKSTRLQQIDMTEIRELYNEAERGKYEVKEELLALEAIVYQNTFQQERQLLALQQEYTLLKNDRLDKKKRASTTQIEETVSSHKSHETVLEMEQLLDMYESILGDIKEVVEANNVDEIELKIMTQYYMMKHFIEIKNKLLNYHEKLIKRRILIQQRFMEKKDNCEWHIINHNNNVENLQKNIKDNHCKGYKLQKIITHLGEIVADTRMSIETIHQKLESLDLDRESNEDKEKSLGTILEECNERIVQLTDLFGGSQLEAVPITYRAFLEYAQVNQPPENLRITFPKTDEEHTRLRIYADDTENDEHCPTRESVKKQSSEIMEAQKILKKKAAFNF